MQNHAPLDNAANDIAANLTALRSREFSSIPLA
ncbi:hypothetical protein JCM5805K_1383 [Lactococcus lactis subsp. lactis]|uniref:Uncharacterized protein n=1 Tax=Lactococcus lactis subsp. lactis TaxID=1360 RepID=A0A0B8QTG2_LACLL|nr:hypothetical protein JCM5805K_1383 [Lactococcus lactis subsp. lactis]